MIVPISAVSTSRMESLQNLLIETGRTIEISNFDDRPGKIFKDLEHCRSSIIIIEKDIETSPHCSVYTTTYNRWYTEDRKDLFSDLKFAEAIEFIVDGSISKIGEDIEKSILKKIFSNTSLEEYLSEENTGGKIWYHNAPQYWIRVMDFIPYFWNERDGEKISVHLKELNIDPPHFIGSLLATLNSSLFYWFFILYSNGRDLNKGEIKRFPLSLDKIDTPIIEQLKEISQELMEDYKKNAKRKECIYDTTGKVIYDEFFPGKSKHIIDKIDELLAEHYKFTEEEIDYIKNFSLEFRLGNE